LPAFRWPLALTHPWLVPAVPSRSALAPVAREEGEPIVAANCSPRRLELCQQCPRSRDVVGKSAWRQPLPLGIMRLGKLV